MAYKGVPRKDWDMVIYFAYGSNMNPWQMRKRVPAARAVGVARLDGWKVVERMYADIQRDKNQSVFGVLYAMQYWDMVELDRYEGAPKVYKRIELPVQVGGETIKALTYVMTPETRKKRNGVKYDNEYRDCCSTGAKMFGIRNAFEPEMVQKELDGLIVVS